ncbi:MAG: sugar transferase [Ilumatobacter sp.]
MRRQTIDRTTGNAEPVVSNSERLVVERAATWSSLFDDGEPQPPDPFDRVANASASTIRRRMVIIDFLSLATGASVALILQAVIKPVPDFAVTSQMWLLLAALPAFAIGAAYNQMHRSRANERPGDEARNIAKTVSIGIGALLLVALVTQFKDISRLWVFLTAVSMWSMVMIERQIARRWFARRRAEGLMQRRIVVVGTDEHALGIVDRYTENPALGYEVVGLAGDDPHVTHQGIAVLGERADLPKILADNDCCGVVVSLSSVPDTEVNALTRRLTDDGFHVALSSSLRDIDVWRLRPQWQDGQTLIYIEPVIRHGWRAGAKRVLDLALAALILIATLPMLLAAIIAIKVTSPGPAFFRQVRVGRHGEAFVVLKLRTMVVDAEARKAALAADNEADGPLFKMEQDPRVTSIGRWLRKLSIDELPQLLCVIGGTMSMVGPRPALPDEVEQWDETVRERLRVLPGLTGMWQVSGRSNSSFEQYKRLDLYYVDNWSLSHDLRICARTVSVVLTGRGAS